MDTPSLRGLSAAEFFALGLEGGSMTDAHIGTRIAYSTVHRAKSSGDVGRETAKALAAWSRTVPAAIAAGACIDAAKVLGLDDATPADAPAHSGPRAA